MPRDALHIGGGDGFDLFIGAEQAVVVAAENLGRPQQIGPALNRLELRNRFARIWFLAFRNSSAGTSCDCRRAISSKSDFSATAGSTFDRGCTKKLKTVGSSESPIPALTDSATCSWSTILLYRRELCPLESSV